MAASRLRIGTGTDIHRLAKGRRCVLGGVTIPCEFGPEGHSDADVLTHALMDALLGACGKPDIGKRFPNTDPRFKDADSITLLKDVWSELQTEGFSLVNADCTMLAEIPKISPHTAEIKRTLAEALRSSPEQIGIKATTAEGLGAVGRREGIMATVVVLIEKVS